MVAEQGPVGADDDHVAAVEADADVPLGAVLGQPTGRRQLPCGALGVAVGEAALGVVGRRDVDEADGALVVGDDVGGLPVGTLPLGGKDLVTPALAEPGRCLDGLGLQFVHEMTSLSLRLPLWLPCGSEGARVAACMQGGKPKTRQGGGPKAARVFLEISAAPEKVFRALCTRGSRATFRVQGSEGSAKPGGLSGRKPAIREVREKRRNRMRCKPLGRSGMTQNSSSTLRAP